MLVEKGIHAILPPAIDLFQYPRWCTRCNSVQTDNVVGCLDTGYIKLISLFIIAAQLIRNGLWSDSLMSGLFYFLFNILYPGEQPLTRSVI